MRTMSRKSWMILASAGVALSLGHAVHASAYFQEVLADNPIAYYRLGESSGTNANDASPNNNDGTYTGSFTLGTTGALSPADPDTATTFPGGTGNRVDTTLSFNPAATSFTVELWLNANSATAGDSLVSQTDGAGTGRSSVYIFASGGGYGVSSFLAGVDSFSGFGVIAFDTWQHIVLVVTDNGATSDIQWYRNGVAGGSATGVAVEAADGIFKLAAAKDNSGSLDGVLDEVAIYTTALSAGRVAEHFNSRFTAIPEPASAALAAAGVVLLALRRRGSRG